MNKFISLQSFYQFSYVQDCAQLDFDKLHEISLRHFATSNKYHKVSPDLYILRWRTVMLILPDEACLTQTLNRFLYLRNEWF